MRRRNETVQAGQVHRLWIESAALKGNLLGDPTNRAIDVYTPAGSDGAGLPLLINLPGFHSSGLTQTNWRGFGENMPERLDRLIGSGAMAPCVVAFPDCFTRLGGNQYINSEAVGLYDDFLRLEIVPIVEKKFRCGGEGRRGLFGKSSGGYGAFVHALLHPDFWAASACHSGDAGFELCYLPEMPRVLRALARYGGSPEAWFKAREETQRGGEGDGLVLMMLAMAATYDPDPSAFCGIRLPVDPHTCALLPARWKAWMRWDPCVMIDTLGPGLKALKAIYLDCGDADQFNLVYGARKLHAALEKLGVAHDYSEFPGGHMNVDFRMDESLPILAKALSG